ncbi:serine/threonine protein kinase [Capronia epimyces CBS 606.96]|uniref:Serine/threonine protein kinase n=1 Tax=Capronia epimyces CBS 606.96 TaxID=1182542 RepID=W9XZB0_9EURO|nr:serine/threonine protein kinase [Capronia epimyces CBS 606.96]EXJ82316.1 serine/threonine protein kinase [Capronia epimyces CBS 606.96]
MDSTVIDVDPTSQNLIACGIFTLVHRLNENCVRKVPRDNDADNIQAVQNEANIYAMLGDDDHFAICLSANQSVEHVDLKWAANGTLEDYIQKEGSRLTTTRRYEMGCIIIEAVQKLHHLGVIHSDLALRQYLLSEDYRLILQLRDIQGILRWEWKIVQSDLFALGSTLYELMVGQTPYQGKSEDEIQLLYEQGKFPGTNYILCGDVILGCWTKQFNSADQVLDSYRRSPTQILN